MIFIIYFLTIAQLIHADTWSATTTNCLWNEYTPKNRLSKRIDLRDIRNQLFTYVKYFFFDLDLFFFFSISLNDSIYYFNPCKTFNLPIGSDPYTVQGEQCHNVLGCKKIQRNKDLEEYYTIAIRLNSTVLRKFSPLTIRYYGSK
jgi:hypothetical protein